MLSKVKAYISTSPVVHVVVAAFIGAAIPILLPVLDGGSLSVSVVKVALAAGIGAALRAVALLVPTKTA